MRKLKAIAVTIAVAVVIMLGASASPASATTDYGIDMNEVCHYEVASSSYALLVSPGYIPDWRCQSGYNQFGLDLALWCAYS